MALIDNRRQRTFTLCALYFAQGVPWGFMLISLPSYLAYTFPDEFGVTEIGTLKAIILVPWSFKLIWAPLIDSLTVRSMGRRRPWIIGAELMMAVTLLGFFFLGDLSQNMRGIVFMYFLHNCFASMQDVCTDALAVDILPPHEQGQMNGLMWGTKLVGKGVGAWALSIVLKWGGLEACMAVQIGLLLGIMIVPMLILERPGEKRFPWSAGQAGDKDTKQVSNPLHVVKSFFRAFSLTTTLVFVVFTLAKLIGVGINESVTNVLYTQDLSPKWTDQEFSKVAGLYAVPAIIVGAVLGGFLADRFGRRMILTVGYVGYALVAVIFVSNPGMWDERWFATTYLVSYEALAAVGSVGFLSMAMRISWTTAAATVFTTYMTLSNVSHMAGNWLAGPVQRMMEFGGAGKMLAYERTFWFVALITLSPLLLLFLVRPVEVDVARDAELAKQTED